MREGGRGTGLPFPVSPLTATVALRLDYLGKPTLLDDAGGPEGAVSGSPQIFRPSDAVSFQHCDSGGTRG